MYLSEWIQPFKERGTEIKIIGGHFYKYAVSYHYDKEKKKRLRKIFTNPTNSAMMWVMFDSYKNCLAADVSYMQNRYVMEGWLFAKISIDYLN